MKTKHEAYLKEEMIFKVTTFLLKVIAAFLIAFYIWGVVDLYELIDKSVDASTVSIIFYFISSFVTGIILVVYCSEFLNASHERHLNAIDDINKRYDNTNNMET
jgi:fructose-specific phosphotransferase system IIC component